MNALVIRYVRKIMVRMIAIRSDSLSHLDAFSPSAFAHHLHAVIFFIDSFKDHSAIIAPIPININTRCLESKVMTFRINGLGNKSVRFKGRTKINKITPGPSPTATVTPSTTSINEGSSVTFTVNTTNFPSGTLTWSLNTVSGTINTSDFNGGAITGSFNITSSTGSVALTLENDLTTEGKESFQLQVINEGNIIGTSPTITINDTSTAPPTYSVTPSSTSLSEASGQTCTFTVNTTSVTPGTVLYYDIVGTNVTGGDFLDNLLTGSFSISGTFANGNAYLSKTIKIDAAFEGNETFTMNIRTSNGGTIVATSSVVTIVDAAYAASFNGSSQALAVTNNGDFATNGIDYTIEFFLKSSDVNNRPIFSLFSASKQFEATYSFSNSSTASFSFANLGLNFNVDSVTGAGIAVAGTGPWIHVAMCFSSSELRIYFNGSRVKTSSSADWGDLSELTTANGVNFLCLGGRTTNGSTITNPKNCSISNFRWVTGSALYTGASLTVPSVPLTAVTGTKVLLLNGTSNLVSTDISGTNKTVTNIGSVPKVQGP